MKKKTNKLIKKEIKHSLINEDKFIPRSKLTKALPENSARMRKQTMVNRTLSGLRKR